MRKWWTDVRAIIGESNRQNNLFISLIDENGKIVCANANMLRNLHLKNPREVSSNFYDILYHAHHENFRKAIQSSYENSTPCSTELYLKNGHFHPMKWEINYLPGSDPESKTYLCLGYKESREEGLRKFKELCHDDPQLQGETLASNEITADIFATTVEQLCHSNNLLSEQESIVKAFLKMTPNLAWVVDDEERLVFASDAFFRMYGLSKERSPGMKMSALLPEVVYKTMYKIHIHVLESGKAIEKELIEKLADGTNISFHLNVFPIQGSGGKKLLGGHAVNLANKHSVEKQLRDANDRLLNLSRANCNAVWEWDMQTGNVFRNEALLEMIGYPMEDTRGLTWWFRRIHPEDRNRVSDKVKETTEKKRHSWEDEYRFKCEDGQYKHIRDHGYVVYENELPVKMIGSLEDVTELRALENKLMEEKLQRQKELSETVFNVQEKERNRIGHELHDNVNQILSTVRLYLDMLTPFNKEEKALKVKTNKYLQLAIEEIRKLSKELVVCQMNGRGLAESVQTLVDDIHYSNVIKIKYSHDPEIELLQPAKKVTFLRIVQEQLKNILKHSQGKLIDISLRVVQDNVQLIIQDDGVGFDSKQTHQGIGLSNIHERTRFYEGHIDIQTSPGNGCKLEVTIPNF